jgi:hypothetical protein
MNSKVKNEMPSSRKAPGHESGLCPAGANTRPEKKFQYLKTPRKRRAWAMPAKQSRNLYDKAG